MSWALERGFRAPRSLELIAFYEVISTSSDGDSMPSSANPFENFGMNPKRLKEPSAAKLRQGDRIWEQRYKAQPYELENGAVTWELPEFPEREVAFQVVLRAKSQNGRQIREAVSPLVDEKTGID